MSYQIDLFSVFILLGIVQGFFLLFFFFSKTNREIRTNLFHGIMLFCIVGCIIEIFLMYTGYIIHLLHLVDFSEVLGFTIGPAFYLMVLSLTRTDFKKANYLHFVFPLIYLILQLPFLSLPEDAKYNAWIGAYHPGLPERPFDYSSYPKEFWLTDYCTELTLASLLIYGSMGMVEVFRVFREKNNSFWNPTDAALKYLRWSVFQIATATLGILFVKIFHKNDTGDHLFAVYVTFTIYATSFQIIKDSTFFKPANLTPIQKIRASLIAPAQQQELLQKLNRVMADEKPYLSSNFSLPQLARKLGTSVHVLSQAINAGLDKTFFEMVAEYRVEEAKQILRQRPNIKVEEIAEVVGYNSKSSFNTAFKKFTGSTPSEFRATIKSES